MLQRVFISAKPLSCVCMNLSVCQCVCECVCECECVKSNGKVSKRGKYKRA